MSNETLVFNGPVCLIQYMRMVRFIQLSVERWGPEVCWGDRTFDRLQDLEQEVDTVIFEVLPPATAVWIHAFMGWQDGLRLLCMEENVRVGFIAGAKRQRLLVQGKAAEVRWSLDPTQKAKAAIRDKWESWWVRKEVKYKNDEEFGRVMHRDFPEYESERSIANLSRKWKKEIA